MKKRFSILTDDMTRCYITGSTINIHIHEIFFGSFRQKSIKWGCCVPLRADWHNMSNYGVHYDHDLDIKLKKECQKRFEEIYGHEKFMEVFRKNYL